MLVTRVCSKPLTISVQKHTEHTPGNAEYGIISFVYRAKRPFDLARVFDTPVPGVIRARGPFRLATRSDRASEVSMVGPVFETRGLGLWWAVVSERRWREELCQRMGKCVARAFGNRGREPRAGARKGSSSGCWIGMPGRISRVRTDVMFERGPVSEIRFIPAPWREPADPFPRQGRAA